MIIIKKTVYCINCEREIKIKFLSWLIDQFKHVTGYVCDVCDKKWMKERSELLKKKKNKIELDRESGMEVNPIREIFTLENAIKFYKKFSDNNPYKCSWVSGLEGELIQFIYKSGDELVVERIHIDDLEDARDWGRIGYQEGTEMIFTLGDLKDLTKFMEGK